jgi:NADPH-dependent 2,4-dienoyl-CoA reductase/sulfur reductase-like enzyme
MRDRVVVVGSSLAGIRTGQALRAAGFDGEIAVVGAEDVAPYDKPPLSKDFLDGRKEPADFALLGDGWEPDGLTPVLGRAAVGLDCGSRHVVLDGGERLDYGRLVIATGGRPRRLTGADGRPVGHTVRDLTDGGALRTAVRCGGHVVVIGGGFIGCEVAATARRLGCAVTIVDTAATPMAHAVGATVGELLARRHAEEGTTLLAGATVASLTALDNERTLVSLTDGRVLEAEVLVNGIGIVPATEWLAGSPVTLDDGVRTDEFCRALGAPDVHALGDVARWHDLATGRPRRVGHWTNAVDQANVVAHNILHPHAPRAHRAAPYFWSDQYGHKIQMIGHVAPADRPELYEVDTAGGSRPAAVFVGDGRLTAAVTVGWPRGMATLRRLWTSGAAPGEVRAELDALGARPSAVTPA